jgi:Neprosin
MRKLALVAVVATVGCSAGSSPSPGESVGSTSGAPTSAVATSADTPARVRQFLDARYRATDVKHSFHSSLGQEIDCIDFFAQPGVKALAARGHAMTSIPQAPPTPAGFQSLDVDPAGAVDALGNHVAFDGELDENGSARSCPEGTVPQVRITEEQVQHAGGVEAFRKLVHHKEAAPSAPKKGAAPDEYGDCEGDTPGYAHVVGFLNTPYNEPIAAGSSTMAIYGPSIPSDPTTLGDHSIAQTWMVAYTPTGNVQTVEVGWNVDGSLYDGDTNAPHLFIYSTDDDYDLSGCYNDWAWTESEYEGADGGIIYGSCVPWVQISNRYTPGMALPASVAQRVNPRDPSSLPKDLSLTTVKIGQDWWLLMQVSGGLPTLLGYYSGTEINAQMTNYEVGGEVFDWTGTFVNDGVEMGSGLPPSEGQGFAAYHRNYFAVVPPTDGGSPIVDDAYVCSTAIADYTYSATPKPVVQAGGPWVNYFYYGGNPTSSTSQPVVDAGVK